MENLLASTPTHEPPSYSHWVGGLSGEVPVISEIGGSMAVWAQAGPTHYIFSLLCVCWGMTHLSCGVPAVGWIQVSPHSKLSLSS